MGDSRHGATESLLRAASYQLPAARYQLPAASRPLTMFRNAAGVGGGDLVETRRRAPQISQQAVVGVVDPPVDRDGLAAGPRLLHDGRAAHVAHLIDDVQLAESVALRLVSLQRVQLPLVPLAHVLHVAKPVVDEAQRRSEIRRASPAAAGVRAH